MTTSTTTTYSMADLRQMAEAICKGRLYPQYQTPESILTLMLLCQADGLHPVQALRRYNIIRGQPAMRADAMLAEYQARGGTVQWLRSDATEARAIFSHPLGGKIEHSYTIEEARAAGLVRQDSGWTRFPAAMLRARLISSAIRMVLPGVVCGVYTPEEVADFDSRADELPPQPAPTPQPAPQPAPQPQQVQPEPAAPPVADTPAAPATPPAPPATEQPHRQPPAGHVDQAAPARLLADQLRRIRALAIEAGAKTHEDVRAMVVRLVGRELASSYEMTAAERQRVIERLEAMVAENKKKEAK